MLEFWIFLVGPQSMGDWVAQAERAKKRAAVGGDETVEASQSKPPIQG